MAVSRKVILSKAIKAQTDALEAEVSRIVNETQNQARIDLIRNVEEKARVGERERERERERKSQDAWGDPLNKTRWARFLNWISRGQYYKAQMEKWYDLSVVLNFYHKLLLALRDQHNPISDDEAIRRWNILNNMFVMVLSKKRHPWFDQARYALEWAILGGVGAALATILLGNPITWGVILLSGLLCGTACNLMDPASKLNWVLSKLAWIAISLMVGSILIPAVPVYSKIVTSITMTAVGFSLRNTLLPAIYLIAKNFLTNQADLTAKITFTQGPSSQAAIKTSLRQVGTESARIAPAPELRPYAAEAIQPLQADYAKSTGRGWIKGYTPTVKLATEGSELEETISNPYRFHQAIFRQNEHATGDALTQGNKDAKEQFIRRAYAAK